MNSDLRQLANFDSSSKLTLTLIANSCNLNKSSTHLRRTKNSHSQSVSTQLEQLLSSCQVRSPFLSVVVFCSKEGVRSRRSNWAEFERRRDLLIQSESSIREQERKSSSHSYLPKKRCRARGLDLCADRQLSVLKLGNSI